MSSYPNLSNSLKITPLICGYACQDHLLLDLDNYSLWQSTQIAKTIMTNWSNLGDCLIVQSSEAHYHLIFDNKQDYDTILHITQTLSALGVIESFFGWAREFRHDTTLRISPKMYRDKTSPTPKPLLIIHNDYETDHYGIKKYLNCLHAFSDDKQE